MVKEPSYWYESQQKMKAACVECKKKHSLKGFFWPGHLYGYGDYDLNCSICNKELHKRDNEAETSL
jgi:hypothetical protein